MITGLKKHEVEHFKLLHGKNYTYDTINITNKTHKSRGKRYALVESMNNITELYLFRLFNGIEDSKLRKMITDNLYNIEYQKDINKNRKRTEQEINTFVNDCIEDTISDGLDRLYGLYIGLR